jgi:hypothetical protein
MELSVLALKRALVERARTVSFGTESYGGVIRFATISEQQNNDHELRSVDPNKN